MIMSVLNFARTRHTAIMVVMLKLEWMSSGKIRQDVCMCVCMHVWYVRMHACMHGVYACMVCVHELLNVDPSGAAFLLLTSYFLLPTSYSSLPTSHFLLLLTSYFPLLTTSPIGGGGGCIVARRSSSDAVGSLPGRQK